MKGAVNRRGVLHYYLHVTTGSAGAIVVATTDTAAVSGFAIVKTAAKTGRYTLTANNAYRNVLDINVSVSGPADATYGSGAVGTIWCWRNNNMDNGAASGTGGAASTRAGTIELQFRRQDTGADAELPDNTQFKVRIDVEEGV